MLLYRMFFFGDVPWFFLLVAHHQEIWWGSAIPAMG
jgi:hypothetical protein